MVQTLRTIFFNSTAQVIGKLVTAGVTFLITVIVARSLGQSGFGEFTLMTSYAALFYMVADFGFNAIAIREAGGDEGRIKESFRNLLGLRIVFSLGLVFLALAVISFLPYSPGLKLAAIVMTLTILTQAVYQTTNLIFQFKLRYDLSAIAASVGSLVNLGLVLVLSQGDLQILLIAGSYVAAGLSLVAVSTSLARTLVGPLRPEFNPSGWSGLVAMSLPIGLTLVFNLVYFRADAFILSFYQPLSEVGIYGAAYKFFEVALVAPVFLMNAIYPILIRSYENDRAKFRRIVRISILSLAGLGVVAGAVGIILSPWFFSLVYQGRFDASVLPFQILAASLPIYFLSSLYLWVMVILRRQKTLALVYALGMLVNIALNLKFIPLYSYNAAAITTGVSEALILTLTYYFSKDWSQEKQHEGLTETSGDLAGDWKNDAA